MPPEPAPFGILLLSGNYERAHYAFMLAAGAAAIGRPVVLFATNRGVHALCRDWSGLAGSSADAAVQATGVAGFDELRMAVRELGAATMACDAGLRIAAVAPGLLLEGVEVAGIPAFLSAVASGQIVTL